MINVSNEFKRLMDKKTDFKENAEITFADGTVLNLTEKDFTVSNNNVTDASETNGIPLGVAVCRSIQIELMNDNDRFSEYDFFGAVIRLYLTFQLSETVERIEYGTFTVLTPETYGTTVIITALDDMHKADKEYSTKLIFPSTIGTMFRDACTILNIPQGTTTFLNDDFVVNEKPTDITFREVIGYIAMIAGGNARIDTTGRLKIITYNFSKLEELTTIINGGVFSPWDNPTDLDGGSFSPWNIGDIADGGSFTDRNEYHMLSNWKNLKVDTDDVVITGVQTTYQDEENNQHVVIYGTDGYTLSINNPLIVGKEEVAVGLIGNVMVGGRFRQFSGDIVANPTIEFMDIVSLFDRKGNAYSSFVTDINFQFFGFTSIKNSAEPTLRNSAKTYSESAKTFVKAKKLVDKERTAREKAVEQLAKDLSESSGLYVTTENQADGSKIYYMHDKPTLAESMIVWKLTSLAFGISTDGGKTYPYGFTVDGETITRLLYADGIDVKNLVVGENVQMGPKATISWENVKNQPTIPTNTNQLVNGAGYTTLSAVKEIGYINAIQATQITKDTVTTSFVNALNVKAGSVEAENIIGDTFSGKKYVSNIAIGVYETQTSIDGGTITSQLTNGSSKSVLDYFGLDISSSSGQQKTEISSTDIKISSSGNEASLKNTELLIKSSYSQTKITNNSISVKDGDNSVTTIEGKLIKSYGSDYNYTTVEGAEIYLYNGTTSNLTITSDTILLNGGYSKTLTIASDGLDFDGTLSIKQGTTSLMEFATNSVTVKGSYTYLGASGGSLGFFGTTTKSTKKTVSTITSTSSATASTNATKINEIINALKAYNLI